MMVSVAISDQDHESRSRFVLTADQPGGLLSHRSDIGGGVVVDVDLMAPNRWRSVAADVVDETTTPLLRALVGPHALRVLRALASECHASTPAELTVVSDAAGPWLRVAAVDALDRWLQLPLDQSLVDAERGVSRARAAQTLPRRSAARKLVLGEALYHARHAAPGVVGYLSALGAQPRTVPARLMGALRTLVAGYGDLLGEVEESSDHQLAAVLDAWQLVSTRVSIAENGMGEENVEEPTRPRPRVRRRKLHGPASLIDPRQVRARVFALSADPASAEVTMVDTRVDSAPAVLVRVPAFSRVKDEPVAQRLLVRLVDPRTDDPRGQSVLSWRRGRSTAVYFEGVVPLRGAGTDAVRADVFDALSKVPPATADTDRTLHEVRRATVFLGEWRRLVADAQISAGGGTPARRLRELARRLTADEPADQPLFPGGPSHANLDRLATTGDRELADAARRLSEEGTAGSAGLLATVSGAGSLLAAEVTAAFA